MGTRRTTEVGSVLCSGVIVLLTLSHSDYEEEEDQVDGERDDGILFGAEMAGKTAYMDLPLWTWLCSTSCSYTPVKLPTSRCDIALI